MTPFFLGNLKLPNKVFYAPLAGCSDLPFRRMSRLYSPSLIYCEMVKIDAVVRNDPNTFRLLDYDAGMHPIGAQLCGSKPKMAGQAAKIITDLGFDVIDFNCGCPVDKVTKDGSGSGMLKNPELIGDVLSEIIAATRLPVTVKVRTGWDENHINVTQVTRIAEKAGAKAITVHGRTREQGYSGLANRDLIKAAKQASTTIPVIGNGDIFTAESALDMFCYTNCDAILVARGTMGQPWIAEDILRALSSLPPLPRTIAFLRSSLLTHFSHITAYQPERQALLDMRRVGCYYLKRLQNVKELRQALNRSATTTEVFSHLESFPWESAAFTAQVAYAEDQC